MTEFELCAHLRRWRFNFANEAQLQDGVAGVLLSAGVPFSREHWIDGGRIDFLVHVDGRDIGVEVKTDGSLSALVRQLHRYAAGSVAALVVVTSRRRLARLPDLLNGKPVLAVCVSEVA